MPPVQGILETALYVHDLEQAAEFYRGLFGFTTLLASDRLVALNVAGRSVLLLFKKGLTSVPVVTSGGVIPGHDGSGAYHFAFAISKADILQWQQHLAARGIAVESEVNWPGGAISLYFRDPDRHVVELITEGFWTMGS